MSRRRQAFRPYRLSPRRAKTDRCPQSPKITPFEPPVYCVGDIIHCLDKSSRAITKTVARERVWIYHWKQINGDGEGMTEERCLVLQDVFK
jgi:hypothetical protein